MQFCGKTAAKSCLKWYLCADTVTLAAASFILSSIFVPHPSIHIIMLKYWYECFCCGFFSAVAHWSIMQLLNFVRNHSGSFKEVTVYRRIINHIIEWQHKCRNVGKCRKISLKKSTLLFTMWIQCIWSDHRWETSLRQSSSVRFGSVLCLSSVNGDARS